jgi:glycosyltransferase involved in cell wall biosynthesis
VNLILVCPEPLWKVTGGIGTYSRELVKLFIESGNSVTVITKDISGSEMTQSIPGSYRLIDYQKASTYPNNIFPIQLQDSYSIWQTIKALCEDESFDFIEFPDYEGPGYFTIQAKLAGHDLPRIFVRLHSPLFMLHDDNQVSAFDLSTIRLRRAEYESILGADRLLYGAPAMRDRIYEYFPEHAEIPKAVQISHPVPVREKSGTTANFDFKRSNRLKIGCIGRQEYRKGWDQLFRNCEIPWDKVEFHFFGSDTTVFNGQSCRDFISRFVPISNKDQVVFHGYKPTSELNACIDEMDSFIFPSRFENFPNALLEVLSTGKPIMVSVHGGMPFISKDYTNVKAFDPNSFFSLDHLFSQPMEAGMFRNPSNAISASYADLIGESEVPSPSPENISVVIPLGPNSEFLNEAIDSCLNNSLIDEILVVGNNRNSIPKEISSINSDKVAYVATNLDGPGQARQYGLNLAKNRVIQFLDSDDRLVTAKIERNLIALLNPVKNLSVVTCRMRVFGLNHYEWMPSPTSASLISIENFSHSGLMVNRERLKLADLPNVAHDEDWIQNVFLVLSDEQIAVDPDTGYLYRSKDESRSTELDFLRFETNFQRMRSYAQWFNYERISLVAKRELLSFSLGKTQGSEILISLESKIRKYFRKTIVWPLIVFLARKILNRLK